LVEVEIRFCEGVGGVGGIDEDLLSVDEFVLVV
jgi:hypothetical protein